MLNVADVSSAQGGDIAGILAENDAVIVKATEGNYYVNNQYEAQVKQVQDSGKRLGLYHFIHGGVNAEEQANYFLNKIGDLAYNDQVPLILDFENNGALYSNGSRKYPVLTGQEIKPFADVIKAKTGKTIWLYVGQADVKNYNLQGIGLPLWVAGYPLNDGSGWTQELQTWADGRYFSGYRDKVTMWQYTSAPYDKSVFYADVATWDNLAKKNSDVTYNTTSYTFPATGYTSQPQTAIEKFKAGKSRFVLKGEFTISDIQNVNGIWQIKADELAPDNFDWTNNGIPTTLLENVSRPGVRDFEPGEKVKFADTYDDGYIDKYDPRYNVIGIYYNGGKWLIWYDANKFWEHA